MSKKVIFFFSQTYRILKGLLAPYLRSHFHGGSWGKYFEKTHYQALILLRHMLNIAQSIARAESIAHVGFAARKAHLE
jgi:hypothetical protein